MSTRRLTIVNFVEPTPQDAQMNTATRKEKKEWWASVLRRACFRILARGQAMVEFAMVMTVALFVLLLGIQYALIGQCALAINQLAYQGARYASVNTGYDQSAVASYMLAVGSPTLTANSGQYLTISLNPDTTPRTFGQTVTVSIAFNTANEIFLPNPFLGVIPFPTTLTTQESAMSE